MKHGIKILTLIIVSSTGFSFAMDWPDDKPVEKPTSQPTIIQLADGRTVQASPEEMDLLNDSGILKSFQEHEYPGYISLPLTLQEYRAFMKLTLPGGLSVLIGKGGYKKESLNRLSPIQLKSLILLSDKLLLDQVFNDAQDELMKQCVNPARLEEYLTEKSPLPNYITKKMSNPIVSHLSTVLSHSHELETFEFDLPLEIPYATSHNGQFIVSKRYNTLSVYDLVNKEFIAKELNCSNLDRDYNIAIVPIAEFNFDDSLLAIAFRGSYEIILLNLKTRVHQTYKPKDLLGQTLLPRSLDEKNKNWLSDFIHSYPQKSKKLEKKLIFIGKEGNFTEIQHAASGIILWEINGPPEAVFVVEKNSLMVYGVTPLPTPHYLIRTWDIYLLHLLDYYDQFKELTFQQILLINVIVENYVSRNRIQLKEYPNLKTLFATMPADIQQALKPLLQE